jgi:tetratricopeptide (TPR) repeat protein
MKAAGEHFDAFLKAHPNSWEGRHERGLHRTRNKEYAAAIADFRSCLELDPGAHIAMKSLADALRAHGELEEAETWAKRYQAADREATRDRLPGKGE